MKETRITLPELALIAGTRVAAGAGIGLLLSNRLSEGERKAAGWALLLVGALSSVPLAVEVLSNLRVAVPEKAELTANAPHAEVGTAPCRSNTVART